MAEPQSQQQAKTALEMFQDHWKKIVEKGPSKQDIGRGIVAALHDIHRRAIEEPWFGRTIHDVVSYYNNQGGRKDRDPPGDDQQETKDKEQKQDGEKKNDLPGDNPQPAQDQGPAHDYSPDALYGRDQGKDGQQQEAQQREYSRGMER